MRLDIRKATASETLIELGVRMGVSVGGVDACSGSGAPLVGAFTLREALDRAIAGRGCAYAFVDSRTIRFSPVRPAPRPQIVARPVTPAVVEPVAPLAPLIVTAGKRPARLGSLPGGVSVIGSPQLQDTGVGETASVSRQTAGFITTNLGAARNKILLRGLSDGTFTGRTQSTVGTYLDDLPVNYNAPDPDLRLIDVDRVEVLRGPQGALYGGGSLSGIYRIVTRPPELGVYAASAGTTFADTESGSNSYRFEGLVNVPTSAQSALRAMIYHDVDGGYLDDVNLRLSNVDRTTRRGGRVAWRAERGEWEVRLGAAGQSVSSKDTQYVTLAPGGPRRANQVRENHRNRLGQTSLKVSGAGDWGRFESVTGYVTHKFASRYDATLALTQFAEEGLELGLYDESSRVRMAIEDALYTGPERGRLRWMVGAFAASSIEEGDAELRVRTSNATRTIYNEDRKDLLNEYAVYGEASYDLGGGWKAAVGGRSFKTSVHTRSYVLAPSPGVSRDLDRKASFSGFSPKISLQRDLSGGGMIYVLTSEGYRAGGFNSGGLVTPSETRRTFRPDHLRNYELGATLTPFNARLNLRTALFYVDWRDIQTDQYFSSGLSYTANIGDGRNRGVEIEAAWRATGRLTVSGNALFNEPKLTRIAPGFGIGATASLPGVPDVSFGSLITYHRPLTANASMMLTAETGYIGRSRLTFDPRYSPSMGGYYTGKLSAQVMTDRWRAAMFVSNPWNSSSDTFAYGNPFSFGQVRQVTPQRPRTWSLALSANF
ncbi:TonB-dependent receptor [Caulobacter segnis]|uniref:TonB-dependent receptor plug n=2 Tax=Caulobacter segnis TaxID=88688 RepID=D5VEG5_CAUST|nr:TonB-dependent receptor [Caulobacter segnis]ADG09108.1 TonB-dependent receptor plug [Caulobacter segnis ATCC 21756]AVQ00929.1 TonB-dependent receptor [Caulobacter segnis]